MTKHERIEPVDFSVKINDVNYRVHGNRSRIPDMHTVDQGLHTHYYCEFQYVYEGSLCISLGSGPDVIVHAGEAVFLPSNLFHGVKSDGVVRFCYKLSPEYDKSGETEKHSDYCRIMPLYTQHEKPQVLTNPEISHNMQRYRLLSERTDLCAIHEARLLLVSNILHLLGLSRKEEPTRASKSKKISDTDRKWIIQEYVSVNYNNKEGLNGLAKALNLSPRQTGLVVQQLMGENFKALITRQRLHVAGIMLCNTDMPMAEIARQVGYDSYSGFYTSFEKNLGYSPDTMRRQSKVMTLSPEEKYRINPVKI